MLLLRSLSFPLNKFYASRKCFHYFFAIGLISPKTQVKSETMNTEHGKKDEAGDQKTPKRQVPKQVQENPVLTY